jgi:pimeloyl-ACP methyl ester carboxylesterase
VNRLPGFVTFEHTISVPLDHAERGGQQLELFAREVVAADKVDDDLPRLLFLQGGPGGPSPRPIGASGLLGAVLEKYRFVLLDQRGTGRSSPVNATTMRGRSATDIVDHLRHFRADAIVADAEALRRHLLGERTWDTLGQSYGGFITGTYLSQAPEGLGTCFVCGGVPPVGASAEEVYRRTYPRVARRTLEYYARYPDDAQAIRRIASHLDRNDVRLPDGDRLTTRRLRLLGRELGFGDAMERVHDLLDDAWATPDELSDRFRYDLMTRTGFVDGPIYALQEFCYGQGQATRWAAQREYDARPEFAADADPLLLTGEMMFPWMFEDIRALRPFREVAERFAAIDDWPPLYDLDALAGNTVPLVAAVYYDDIYVDADLQLDTLRRIGASRAWVTNEFEHDGLLDDAVVRRLFDMAAGKR